MDEKKWDDEFLKSSLKQLPDIRDERSKEDILKRLKADDRLQMEPVKKQQSFKWLPLAIGVAAVFFVMLLVPLLQKGEQQFDQAAFSTSSEMDTAANIESERLRDNAAMVAEQAHYVLLEEMEHEQLLQIDMLFGEQVIPVNFILPAGEEQNWTALFEQYSGKIDAELLGFDGFKNELTKFGTVSYYKTTLPNGQTYLLPKESPDMDVKEALLNMANDDPDEATVSVIPAFIQYDVDVTEKTAVIHFQEQLDLALLNREEAILLLEGFMLTAAQFEINVQFENIEQPGFEQYDLTAPLPKPIGSNPIYYLYDN